VSLKTVAREKLFLFIGGGASRVGGVRCEGWGFPPDPKTVSLVSLVPYVPGGIPCMFFPLPPRGFYFRGPDDRPEEDRS